MTYAERTPLTRLLADLTQRARRFSEIDAEIDSEIDAGLPAGGATEDAAGGAAEDVSAAASCRRSAGPAGGERSGARDTARPEASGAPDALPALDRLLAGGELALPGSDYSIVGPCIGRFRGGMLYAGVCRRTRCPVVVEVRPTAAAGGAGQGGDDAASVELWRRLSEGAPPKQRGAKPAGGSAGAESGRQAAAGGGVASGGVVRLLQHGNLPGVGRYAVLPAPAGRRLVDIAPLIARSSFALARFARGLLEALAAAHEQGIAHGEIGEENILVGADGRVRLSGWWRARLDSDTPPERAVSSEGDAVSRAADLERAGALLAALRGRGAGASISGRLFSAPSGTPAPGGDAGGDPAAFVDRAIAGALGARSMSPRRHAGLLLDAIEDAE